MIALCAVLGHAWIPHWDRLRGFYRECARCHLIERTKERPSAYAS